MLYGLPLSFFYQRDKEAVLPWIAGDYSPGIIILYLSLPNKILFRLFNK